MMRQLTDNEIIESVKKGNRADFSIIVDRYKNKAFSLLKRMLKNEMEAEEVLQDCFLKAFNALNNFKFESKFSTWFYRIVYNTALTRLSLKKRQIESDMSSVQDHFDLENKEKSINIEEKDLSEFIKELIEQLPKKNAAVLTMFYLNEMTCEEISEAMETSISNVKVMLYRSRNALKDVILKHKLSEELL